MNPEKHAMLLTFYWPATLGLDTPDCEDIQPKY